MSKKISFEAAVKRLEEIVKKLSHKEVSLDEMINLYQEGVKLKNFCKKKISETEMKIDVINNKES